MAYQNDDNKREQSGGRMQVPLLDDVSPMNSPASDFSARISDLRITPAGAPARLPLPQLARSWLDPREARPNEAYYRKESSMARPNLYQTTSSTGNVQTGEQRTRFTSIAFPDEPMGSKYSKFGTWDGVYVRCLLNIFGAIMFLRLPWIVGQAGIIQTVIIISLASLVVWITTLSMSAICTNGEVQTGGAYYLISRALGPGIGGSIGILFTFGNAVGTSMYLIALSETLRDNLADMGVKYITGNRVNDVRVYSSATLVLQFFMSLGGLGWITKVQLLLIVLIAAAIICTIIGAFTHPDTDELVYGIDGFATNAKENLWSDYSATEGVMYNFNSVFAIFFPAVTGIMAGANVSGELKNPSKNIPTGTLWAVSTSWLVYCIVAVLIGLTAARGEEDCHECDKGLLNNFYIMTDISVSSGIILAGVYAATFSSALAGLIGAPRILQAIAADHLIPSLSYFKKVSAKGDPIRGYILTFFIVFAVNMVGNLNAVAPLITQFFMMTYTLINFACFFLSYSKTPGWRPTFRYYNKWMSLVGAMMCVTIQFLIQWEYALASCLLGIGLYLYIEHIVSPEVNWGSAIEARKYTSAFKAVMRCQSLRDHIKNYRPNFLVMCGEPSARKNTDLIYFSQTFRHNYGPIIYGNVLIGDYRHARRDESNIAGHGYLNQKQPPVSGLYNSVVARSIREGTQMMIQLSGLGRLQPNTLVLGFKDNWSQRAIRRRGPRDDHLDVETDDTGNPRRDRQSDPAGEEGGEMKNSEYFGIIKDAVIMKMAVMICRGLGDLNWNWEVQYPRHKRRPRGFIDVWWLLDDGGFTVLMPHLIKRHKFWYWMKLRLFVLGPPPSPAIQEGSAAETQEIESQTKKICDLMHKFRLSWDVEPKIVQIGSTRPSRDTVDRFVDLVGTDVWDNDPQPDVTNRWLRVSELIKQYSTHETSVQMLSLPLPRGELDSELYLGLLETLSGDGKTPTVLMRGNQENVLTFYSE